MKTLVLFRHAKSSWKYAELKDFDRPLKKSGRKNARRMGAVLADMPFHPDVILTSPAERAIATAQLVAKELGYDEDRIVEVQELYLEAMSRMMEQVQAINDAYERVILVGHNPGLTDLANALTGENMESLPTAAAYAVQFNITTWKDASAGTGKRIWFEKPSDHKKKERKKNGGKKTTKVEEKAPQNTQHENNAVGKPEESPAPASFAGSGQQ